MKAVLQRVSRCTLSVDSRPHAAISTGLLVFLGVARGDTPEDLQWLSGKIVRMRIFPDDTGKMNLSVRDTGGGLMLVSQFTLLADAKKGNRPSFIAAAPPEEALPLYEQMIRQLAADLGKPVATGIFGADMQIDLINDGPVTIVLDTQGR